MNRETRCLTICSPFASLIADGRKTIENRKTPTRYRGELFVHAGQRRSWGGRSATDWATHFGVDLSTMRYGAIVGAVQLIDCVPLDQLAERYPELAGSPHALGPWCWILARAARLAEPVAFARGQLGLYHVDASTEARVREALPATKQAVPYLEARSC